MKREGGCLRWRGGLNVGLAIRRGVVVVVGRGGWACVMRRMERKRKRKMVQDGVMGGECGILSRYRRMMISRVMVL